VIPARQRTELASDREVFAFEVARNAVGANLPIEDLLAQLGVTQEYFLSVVADEAFRRTVKAYRKEMEENGVSFQLRAAIIAEDGLKELYDLINDKDEPAAVRMRALEKAVDWGRLAPVSAAGTLQGAAPTIVFNFPPGAVPPEGMRVVNAPVEG